MVVLNEDIADCSLFLPAWQAEQLEERACGRGLTAGQLIRLLIRDYLAGRNGKGRLQVREAAGFSGGEVP